MNPSIRPSTRRAFTLIELLVVITIIGILAGLTSVAATQVMAKARKVRTSAAIKDIQLGVKNYQVEYNRYPVKAGGGASEEPIQLSEGSSLLAVLMGENTDQLNPREIRFIEPPVGKGGKGGLVGTEGNYALLDSWGNPYEVIMDTNYDNKVKNPDTENEESEISEGAPQNLPTGVAVYSLGEDGKPNTKDDVVSWRS